ncbi:hypothetical protein [Rhizobium leguminosarum]
MVLDDYRRVAKFLEPVLWQGHPALPDSRQSRC